MIKNTLFYFLSIIINTLTAASIAYFYVLNNDGFGKGNIPSFLFWTLFFSIIILSIYPIIHIIKRIHSIIVTTSHSLLLLFL